MSTRRWRGNAVALKQSSTFAVTGVWATGDTLTATINGKDLVLTIGAVVNVADVVAAMAAAVNASSAGENLLGSESRNVGGQEIAEFQEIEALDQSPNIAIRAKTAGKPVTITFTANTVGSGDVGAETVVTAATGPNHWDNADNWTGGAVPVNGDDVVFDSGNVPVLYGLSQTAVTLASLTVTQGYSGAIGLSEINGDGTRYSEYRPTYLAISATAVTIGDDEGPVSGRIKLDTGTNACALNVRNSGQALESGVPAILWKGAHASNAVNVLRGHVGIAFFAGETATVPALRVGFVANPAGDAKVTCGAGVALADVDLSGGAVEIRSATTTVQMTDGELVLLAGAHASVEIDGGTVFYRSTGTLTSAKVGGGGTLDFSRDMRSRTVTNCEIHARAALNDPYKTVTFTNGVDLYRCSIADLVELNLGEHLTLTPSAV